MYFTELLLLKLLIISLLILTVESGKCDDLLADLIVSDQTKSNNGEYILQIDEKPEKYVANERYRVTVKVDIFLSPESKPKFKKFVLSLKSYQSPNDDDDVTHQTGKFELLRDDDMSIFSPLCPNTVVEANTQAKKQVSVIWVAPPQNSGCVTIKAIVIESREKWYSDDEFATDGFLTKTLCEDFEENEDVLPEVLDFCCACDDAKYEMAFQGNWIRNNHPKGFPEDLFTTKFSDIIGASHTNGHGFWNDGEEPSEGLKELAFNGSTRSLEFELMGNIANLHTIIKARGLSYPNITASSYAVFRVNADNHLVSVVTKIIPSPDWIVGVPSMELCLSNCTWKTFRTINLYPRDVGIDDALEYTGSIPSTSPHPVITEITSSEPSDPRSPFYDESGEKMKPIAKLHFKLEKTYKKTCDPNRKPPEVEDNPENPFGNPTDVGSKCEITGWGNWSSCSVQCGQGHKTRNVIFKVTPEPNACRNVTTEETKVCTEKCEEGEEEKHICDNIVWSPWKPCSATCGKGTKTRYRIPNQNGEEEEGTVDDCANKEVVECEVEC